MSSLSKTTVERAETALNSDPVVLGNIKRSKMTLLLKCEYNEFALAIENGKVRLLKENETNLGPYVSISGTADNWAKITGGLHGGLHRAFRHKLLRFEGDAASMLTIWKTIWRLGEALVDGKGEGR